jgi:hypothetical protein
MSKLILDNVNNIDAVTTINANFDKIEQEFQNRALYRDNPTGEPNTLEHDLDLNGFKLINVGDISPSGYTSFPGTYLGAFATDPTTNNQNGSLKQGDLYFNTSSPKMMRVFNGSSWQAVASTTTTNTNVVDPALFANTAEANEGVSTGKIISPSTLNSSAVYGDLDATSGFPYNTIGKHLTELSVNITDAPWNARPTATGAANRIAINNAIAFVGSNGGGKVIIPSANFDVEGSININYSGVILEGVSTTGSVLTFTEAGTNSIRIEGLSAPGVYNVQLRDFTIAHSLKTGGYAISLYRANQCIFSQLNINNCWNVFECKTINNVTMSNCVAAGTLGTIGCKFYSLTDGTERSDVLTFNDTVFQFVNQGTGIVWDGFAHTLRTFGLGILNAGIGIQIVNTASSGSYYPSFGEFYDLEIDGTTGTSLSIEGGSNFAFTGCELFNLSTSSGPVVDIKADIGGSYTNTIRITGGRIFGGGKEALVMGGRDFLMTGTLLGGGASTGYSCVRIPNGAQDFIITSCVLGTAWGGAINKYDYGLNIANTTYRGLIDNVSFYGCNGNVLNNSTTNTVRIGKYLNKVGVPNEGPFILRQSDSNTGVFEDKLYNTSSGASVTAQTALATGTSNSFVITALKDNNGTPFLQTSCGPAVGKAYTDCDVQYHRNRLGVVMFKMGEALGNYANDAAASAGGVPLYGYYRNGGVVNQRLV